MTSKRSSRLVTRLVLVLTSAAFAVLVTAAASHLHLGSPDDEGCAACVAFGQKLCSAPPTQNVARTIVAACLVVASLPQPQLIGVTPILPPPSCGPPIAA